MLKEELKPELMRAYTSTLVFAKMFFPKRFSRPFCRIHEDIAEVLDGPLQQVAVAAPRGTGKTSMLQLAYASKKILFRESKFVVMVTTSADAAIEQAENLKEYLIGTPLIQELFGDLKGARWAKDRWVIQWADGDKTMILPRGAGQTIRGALYRDDRPDLIIVDDLESDEAVESEIQRAKLRKWFFNSLCNCIDRASKKWKIAVIDTIKHEDCMLQRLLDSSKWHSKCLQICSDKRKSYWPEFITDEEIEELYKAAIENQDLDGFYREYMNMPISIEGAGFTQADFRYHEERDVRKIAGLESFVIVDPSKTTNPRSANTAILGGSVDVRGDMVYFRRLINEQLHPDESVNMALDMCVELSAHVLAVEVTSLHQYITYPIINEIRRRKLNIELIELNATGKKEDRAKGLIPLYRRHQISHNASTMGPLEAQELSFPRPKRWDALDCASYVPRLLDEGDRFFMSSDVDEEMPESVEKEYEELEDDYMDEFDYSDDVPDVGLKMVI